MECTIHYCVGLLVLPLVFLSAAAAQDVNNDGQFDCIDADLIGTAVRNQSMDLSFDFDEDGREEILLGGTNNPMNGIGHPSLLVLEPPLDRSRPARNDSSIWLQNPHFQSKNKKTPLCIVHLTDVLRKNLPTDGL